MSTVATVQRYAVTFNGHFTFSNASSPDAALSRVRLRLLMEAGRKREAWVAAHGPEPKAMDARFPTMLTFPPEPDAALATLESFKKAANARPSLRY